MYMDSIAVRAIRIKLGYTQQQFAAHLGVSRSLIASVEAGFRAVSLKLRIKIAQLVGIDDDIVEAIDRARFSARLA
jgi:transcriptional regulator with XRE-family HTH domain